MKKERDDWGKGYRGSIEHQDPSFATGWVGGPEGGWQGGEGGASHGREGEVQPADKPVHRPPPRITKKR
jgi:hypothetical protein